MFLSVIWRARHGLVGRRDRKYCNTEILFLLEDTKMGSKTQKTETVRHRKHAPNQINRKTDKKVVRQNLNVIGKLEDENRKS